MVAFSHFIAVMEVVKTHMAVKAHTAAFKALTAAVERRKRQCFSGAGFALTDHAPGVIEVLHNNDGANWPCVAIQQPESKRHDGLYALMISFGKEPAVAARGATIFNTQHGPMVRLPLIDVLTGIPINPNDPIQDYFAKQIIGDLPDRLRKQHKGFCYKQSDAAGNAFDQQYNSMHWLHGTSTKKTLMMLGCSLDEIVDANLIEGVCSRLVIFLPPELAEVMWKRHSNNKAVIEMLVAVKKVAALEWCHIVPWREFGPTACGMFLASSLHNLFLGPPGLNQLEGDRLPSPSVAFNIQLQDQLLKAVASTIAWIKTSAGAGAVPLAAQQLLESSLQLAVDWLPGFATCEEALWAAAGNMLSLELNTRPINYTRLPVWLPLYSAQPPTEEYELLQECNKAMAAAAHTTSIQEFWAQPQNVNEVSHAILRLGTGPCEEYSMPHIAEVLTIARPEWAFAVQSVSPQALYTMAANYAGKILRG